MTIGSSLRQWRFPKEFRIAHQEWCGDLRDVLQGIAAAVEGAPVAAAGEEPQHRLLADLGTGLWRLRQKMLNPETAQPLDEMRKAYRHLESVWDALKQAGVEIHDYSGRPFDQGLSLKVIAYQPTPGLTRQRIVETIKPSIYLRDDMLQIGEVIVGTPEGAH